MKKITFLLLCFVASFGLQAQQTTTVQGASSLTSMERSQIEAIQASRIHIENTVSTITSQTRMPVLQTYSDRASFQFEAGMTTMEDFSGGPANDQISGCDDVISSAGDAICYPSGELEAGFEITTDGAAASSPRVVFVGSAAGFGNTVDMVGANFFTDTFVMNFTASVQAVGFDVATLLGGTSVDISVFGAGGLLGTFTVTPANDGAGAFFGVLTDEPITSIEIFDAVNGAELIGMLEFGPGGLPPIISCPADIMADTDPGQCNAVVNFADAVAIDPDGGTVTVTQTMGPTSGSMFPTGDTIVEFTATDDEGQMASCQFTVTVTDNEAPVAACMDITLEVDPVTGMVSIVPADVDNGSSDNCGIVDYSISEDTFTCADIGANAVTLTVTDAEGNTDSCVATVTIEDNTAPVIACIGEPATVSDSEMVSPAQTIDTSGSDVVVTSTISVTDDREILDLNVMLDVEHTWIADLEISLTSPAGTTVALFSGAADGCSADDIITTLDDESVNPFDCNPNGDGDAFPLADYIPLEALSAFDGQSTLGDWTLTIEDTFAGLDSGILNSWGFTYDYEVVPTPLDVVLDASGMATIDASDLLLSVQEACGWTASVGAPVTAVDVTTCGDNLGADIADTLPPTESTAAVAESGTIGTEFTLDRVDLDITHTWDGDLEIVLVSPAGTELILSDGNGGSGDNYTDTVFQDGGADITAASPPFTGTFEAEGGTFAATFDGEDVNGNWVLRITDSAGGDDGTLNNFCLTLSPIVDTTVTFDCSNLGENQLEVFVTDDSGNFSSCTATVNVLDETAPVITCGPPSTLQEVVSDSPALAIVDNTTVSTSISVMEDVTITDLNVDLDIAHTWTSDLEITLESPAGTQAVIFSGAANGCSADNLVATLDDESMNALVCNPNGDGDAFPLDDYMPSNPLSVFDGESSVGDWTISIEDTAGGDTGVLNTWALAFSYDNTNPNVVIELDENGMAVVDPFALINDIDEACGISTAAVDINEVFCSDIGTTLDITVFVSDASGNIASCVAQVDVVDAMAPELTCPADQTVDPGAGNLNYEVPDYFAEGEATATDNCTDPVTITTQDPAPGTLLPDGDYTVTLTAEDEYGNVATCTFELTVESTFGVEDVLANAVSIYPNPARNVINITNGSAIGLDNATIYDVNGRLVQTIDLTNMTTEKTVDVSQLASGVYMVNIQGEGGNTIKRLIKE